MDSILKKVQDLRAIPCLSCLNDKDLIPLGEMVRIKKFYKDDIIFEESEPIKLLFMIKTGSIKLYKTSPGGREIMVKKIGLGKCLGCALIASDKRYVMNASALENSILIGIPLDTMTEVLRGEVNETGLRIISCLCGLIEHSSTFLENLIFKSVEQRILSVLLRIAEEKSLENNIVSLSLTHQDIASMTGTVREVVSRTMSKLKKEGIIFDSTVKGFKLNKEILLLRVRKHNILQPY